jgi:hypothetical protein
MAVADELNSVGHAIGQVCNELLGSTVAAISDTEARNQLGVGI